MQKDKNKAVIFDCDGVMFDSRTANKNYYNSMLTRFNLPLMTPEQMNYVHMSTADEAVDFIFNGTGLTGEAREYRSNLNYSSFIGDMVIEPGLKELLKELRPDYGLAVATNRSNTIEEVLKSNDLSGFFDIVVSSLDVKKPKPDPESVIKILDYFKIEPEMTYYIGDSIVDCQTAQAAGVVFIAYGNPSLNADYHVSSMKELSQLFKTFPGI